MIIITGSIAYDYIMDYPDKFSDHILPEQIHKINLSFIVNRFAKRRGGTAGNVSYSMGLLKTPHVLFSYAGKDFDEYRRAFKKFGIPTNYVHIDKTTYTATGFAMTDRMNNQIWGFFYGAAENNPKLRLDTVAKRNDLVLIGPAGTKGPATFIKQCIQENIAYMFDPGFSLTYISDSDLTLGVQHAAYLIGNDYELAVIKKRVKDWRKYFEKQTVTTTLGEKGAVIEKNGKIYTIAVAKVKQLVDPSGAGDAWRSGFLTGLERNFDVQTCGQMGSIAASFAVEQYGTQEHIFTKKEFAKRYRQTFGSLIKL